jgi:hypothetical protein
LIEPVKSHANTNNGQKTAIRQPAIIRCIRRSLSLAAGLRCAVDGNGSELPPRYNADLGTTT